MSDPSGAETSLPRGYRITHAAGGASAELKPPQPSWGWPGVAFATLWCVIWDLGLLASVGVGAKTDWSGWSEDAVVRWLFFIPFFWIPGVAVTALTLHQIFVRATWVLRPGQVTRRYSVLGLRYQRDDEIASVEVIHGRWSTGRGATETIRLIASADRDFRLHQRSHQSAQLPPDILALATAVAGYLAVPIRVVETVIPEPSSD